MSFAAYGLWVRFSVCPSWVLDFEFVGVKWSLVISVVLLAGLMIIELWGTVIWNEKVGIWGQEEKWFAFLLLWFGQQHLFCFEKSCGGREESTWLTTVTLTCFHVSRCLICEIGVFLENVTSRRLCGKLRGPLHHDALCPLPGCTSAPFRLTELSAPDSLSHLES